MDNDFLVNRPGLQNAIGLLAQRYEHGSLPGLPVTLPEEGVGSLHALRDLAPLVLGGAARLGAATAFANMDPPTPWITWATTLWNASLNQNLLHPATAPVARGIEECIVAWLSPFFGMDGGHLTPGSSLANLTALWAARDSAGIREVVASEAAHLSVAKAARVLGLRLRTVPIDGSGALVAAALPNDIAEAALVLTAGTTSTGAVDPLHLAGRAAWTHVDAAWAGPLRLTAHAARLDGIERADSVAVSAHKWLFQPKESALVLFRDSAKAHRAISFGGTYLAVPNVGLLGSHGATAVPLLATLLAWGRSGLAARIERCVQMAEEIADAVRAEPHLTLLASPRTGVIVWQPQDSGRFDRILAQLPPDAVSTLTLGGERWFRMVAANPLADVDALVRCLRQSVA